MSDFGSIGLTLFLVGIIPWTIGGMISFRMRYDVHNRHLRSSLDPGGKPVQVGQREIRDAIFRNSKSRWWSLIGYGLCLSGMGIMFTSQFLGG